MSDDVEKPEPLKEPSVLDYVKSLFRFGNGKSIQIPMEQTLSPEQVEKKRLYGLLIVRTAEVEQDDRDLRPHAPAPPMRRHARVASAARCRGRG